MRKSAASIGAVVLGTLASALAVASLWWPFQSDHGVYAWMADVVLAGGMPYRDAWDVKGPTALLPALAAQLIFGRNMWGVRVLELLVLAAAVVGLYRLTVRWLRPEGASIAASLFFLLYMKGGFGNTAQPDGFWALLFFLSMVPLIRSDRPSSISLLLAGACVGCLALLKPIYGALLVLPLLAVGSGTLDRRLLRSAAMIVTGFTFASGTLLAWLAAGGALPAFVDAYFRFNAAKNSDGIVSGALETLSDGMLADPAWLAFLGAAITGFLLLRPRDARAARVFGAWIVVALVLVHVQRPFYLYRTHLIVAPVIVLAAFAIGQAIAERGPGRLLAIATTVALAIVIARPALRSVVRWTWQIPGPGNAETLLASHPFLSTTAAGERRLVRAIAQHSAPGDSIYAFRHPSAYVLAHRTAASRFSILAAIGAGAPDAFASRHLSELGRALAAVRPVLLALPDTGGAASCLGCFEPLTRLPSVAAALEPHYRLLRRADGFALFARVDSSDTAP